MEKSKIDWNERTVNLIADPIDDCVYCYATIVDQEGNKKLARIKFERRTNPCEVTDKIVELFEKI